MMFVESSIGMCLVIELNTEYLAIRFRLSNGGNRFDFTNGSKKPFQRSHDIVSGDIFGEANDHLDLTLVIADVSFEQSIKLDCEMDGTRMVECPLRAMVPKMLHGFTTVARVSKGNTENPMGNELGTIDTYESGEELVVMISGRSFGRRHRTYLGEAAH